MCAATSSCTVNEGRHFESVYVVAHEIGHKYFKQIFKALLKIHFNLFFLTAWE